MAGKRQSHGNFEFKVVHGMHWLLVILAAHVLAVECKPGGSVSLEMVSLRHSAETTFSMKIWITCDGLNDKSGCLYGTATVGSFSANSFTKFGATLGGRTDNPLKYKFPRFHGTFSLYFETFNVSSKLDTYSYKVAYYPKPYGEQTLESVTLKSLNSNELKVRYSVFCNEHYYGPSCVVGCLPGKTYTCEKNSGQKLCNPGWLGPECNCTTTTRNTCVNGKILCYPPWYGPKCDRQCTGKDDGTAGYTCDSATGNKRCLSGWHGAACDKRTPPATSVRPSTPYKDYATQWLTMVRSHTPHTPWAMSSRTSRPRSPQVTPLSMTSYQLASSWLESQEVSLRLTSQQVASPRLTSQEVASPRLTSQEVASSRLTSQEVASPRLTSQEVASPRLTSQQVASPRLTSQQVGSPQLTSQQVASPRLTSQQVASPRLTSQSMAPTTPTHMTSHVIVSAPMSDAHARQSISPSIRYNNTLATSSTVVVQQNPGSAETRTNDEVWWIVLLTFILLVLLVTAVFLILRRKKKKCAISTEYQSEVPLETSKKTAEGNDHNTRDSKT